MTAHAADLPGGPLDFGRRIDRLEWRQDNVDDRIKTNATRIDSLTDRQDQMTTNVATLGNTVIDIKDDVTTLKHTLDKLVWAIVGLALTIAGSAVGLALLIAAGGLH
jgi:chromosome segregation ATPase